MEHQTKLCARILDILVKYVHEWDAHGKKTSYFYENAGSEIHPIFKIKSVHEWDPHILSLINWSIKIQNRQVKIIWETMEKVFFFVFFQTLVLGCEL